MTTRETTAVAGIAAAVEQVTETAREDGSAAFALGSHHAAVATLAALGAQADAAAVPRGEDGLLWDGRKLPPAAARLGLRGVPERRGEPGGLPSDPPLLAALQALFDAAVAAGLALGSVERAAELTRRRPRPRPLPGVEAATTDPFSQTLLGQGLSEAWGARALVRAVAAELEAGLAEGGALRARDGLDAAAVAAARDRALAALEVALTTALAQGDRVWQVVGTSGTANKLGFDAAWRDASALAELHPRIARRRALGARELAAA